jgi:hypothetical protein
MNEAAKVCGGKYEIIDRASETTGAVAVPIGNAAVAVRGVHRAMIVRCATPQ